MEEEEENAKEMVECNILLLRTSNPTRSTEMEEEAEGRAEQKENREKRQKNRR